MPASSRLAAQASATPCHSCAARAVSPAAAAARAAPARSAQQAASFSRQPATGKRACRYADSMTAGGTAPRPRWAQAAAASATPSVNARIANRLMASSF
jgi:hypothetical protein